MQQRRYSQVLINGMALSTQDIEKFSNRIGLGGTATAKRPRMSWHPLPLCVRSLRQPGAL